VDDIKERIIKIEVEVESLYKSVERLSSSAIALQGEVAGIQRNLTQIKYFALGAVVLMSADKVGLLKAVGLMFGGI
jgi:hypothetical protein